jgi:hypothetical protein
MRVGRPELRLLVGTVILFLTPTFTREPLGPTQPRAKYKPAALSLVIKHHQAMKLITHSRRIPK